MLSILLDVVGNTRFTTLRNTKNNTNLHRKTLFLKLNAKYDKCKKVIYKI